MSIQINLEQATAIIEKHCSDTSGPRPVVLSLVERQDTSLSSLTPTKSYVIHLKSGSPYVLKISPVSSSEPTGYGPNTLEIEYSLAEKLSKLQDFPQTSAIAYDSTLSIVPFEYILSALPSGTTLSQVRASNKLTKRQSVFLDLRLGTYFKRIHDELQNDWFGLPSQEKEELYSWQEAFTYLLEIVFQDAQDLGEVLPMGEIRKYLSRAIGFFLFDDCEVPSLISFLGDEDSIYVEFDLDSPSSGDEIVITSILPLSHALWGDPLLETVFVNPTEAFLEGYGGSPIKFGRQKTKRMWYTLFQALVVLVQSRRLLDVAEGNVGASREKCQWAREVVARCLKSLEDAPCY